MDATAQTAVSRLTAAEGYRSLSADALKSVRNAKEPRAKRVRHWHAQMYTDAHIDKHSHALSPKDTGAHTQIHTLAHTPSIILYFILTRIGEIHKGVCRNVEIKEIR